MTCHQKQSKPCNDYNVTLLIGFCNLLQSTFYFQSLRQAAGDLLHGKSQHSQKGGTFVSERIESPPPFVMTMFNTELVALI